MKWKVMTMGILLSIIMISGCISINDDHKKDAKVENKLPVARIYFETPSTNVFQGDTIEFDATRSYDDDGEILFYDWEFGGTMKREGEKVDITFLDVGSYTVTLTVEDNNHTTSTDTTTINVLRAIELNIKSYQHKNGIFVDEYLYVTMDITNYGGKYFDLSDSTADYFKIKTVDNNYYDGYISSGDEILKPRSTITVNMDFDYFPQESDPKTFFFEYESSYQATAEFD